jgi:hypothetical protein
MWRLVSWSKYSHSWDRLLQALDSVWCSRNLWPIHVINFLHFKFTQIWCKSNQMSHILRTKLQNGMIWELKHLHDRRPGTLDFAICTLFSQLWGICPQKQIWSFNMLKLVQYTLIFFLEFLYIWWGMAKPPCGKSDWVILHAWQGGYRGFYSWNSTDLSPKFVDDK